MVNAKSDTEGLQVAYELFGKKADGAIYQACKNGSLSFEKPGTSLKDNVGNLDKTLKFSENLNKIIPDDEMIFDFSTIVNWDAKMTSETNISCLNSARYKSVKLKSLATVNPRTTIPIDLEITFVPMENISEVYGELKSERYKNSNEAKEYTKFKEKILRGKKSLRV